MNASVVIPAFNESYGLRRLLSRLADQGLADLEVVVVANGCTDDSATVARSFESRLPGLRVLDLDEAGKIGALNAGDEEVSAFPRIYLDADIDLSGDALPALVAALDTDRAVAASPHVSFDLAEASWTVRAFYRVYREMPYVRQGLIGLGVYGMSGAGRARFDSFPDVTADDLFVQEMFAPAERLTTPGHFTVRVPQRLSDLLAVRSRGAQGKSELERLGITPHSLGGTAGSSARSLLTLLKARPARMLDVGVYVLVTVLARRRAAKRPERWARDESTRRGPG